MLDYLESLGIELDQIEELLEVYDEAVMQSIDLDNMKEIVDKMTEEMLKYAQEMEFEKAAKIRDKIKQLTGKM